MTNKPIYLCASRPGSVPLAAVKRLYKEGVVVAFSGYDEIGLAGYKRGGFLTWLQKNLKPQWPWILPLKDGNFYKHEKIVDDFYWCDIRNGLIYAMDEPFNQGLWRPGMPKLSGDALVAWKWEQVEMCQMRVDYVRRNFPGYVPLITADRPVPDGAEPVTADRIARAYPIHHIRVAVESYGRDWREEFGFTKHDSIGVYTIKPIFGKQPDGRSYDPGYISRLIHDNNLSGFLYYNATDPDVMDADGNLTREMKALREAM